MVRSLAVVAVLPALLALAAACGGGSPKAARSPTAEPSPTSNATVVARHHRANPCCRLYPYPYPCSYSVSRRYSVVMRRRGV